jgi:hypothetical protein
MSRYSYAGPFTNPTSGFSVKTVGEVAEDMQLRDPKSGEIAEADLERYCIAVEVVCDCPHSCCSRPVLGHRFHDSAPFFDESEDASDWIEAQAEFFEQDYDDYLEENRHSIVQMERYEAFMNEY